MLSSINRGVRFSECYAALVKMTTWIKENKPNISFIVKGGSKAVPL